MKSKHLGKQTTYKGTLNLHIETTGKADAKEKLLNTNMTHGWKQHLLKL